MKCFYHNDLDGRCAGSVVALFTGNYDANDYIEIDYVKPIPLDIISIGETVYFVDYSFKEDTKDVLDALITEGCKVIWIDHHDSSINLEEKYPELKQIPGIRSKNVSGALLTYNYLFPFQEVPNYIKLVSDYDTWKFAYKYSKEFKLGMDMEKHDALDKIWVDLYNEYTIVDFDFNLDHFNYIIDNGKLIQKYIDTTNAEHLNKYSYESEINGLKCLVINRSSNSWIFGDKIKEYPIVMVYFYDGEYYIYSIYSSDPTVDCSKIAESYGGGGHKGASGFKSKELLFKKVGK